MKMLAACFVTIGVAAASATAAPPDISDPDARAPKGSMPGIFPEIVTAANVNAAPIAGSVLGGAGSDNIRVQFPSSGPIAWTESRHNEGDIAMLIGPFDPTDSSYFPPDEFVNDYKPLEGGQEFANTTLAWRVNRDNGALLATVRHNGVNNQDTDSGGTPIGTTHGVAYFNADFGQGWGYRMTDGVFSNGGGNSADLQMGVAGFDDGAGEAVFSTATSFFPYSQGWLGAWVQESDGSGVASFSSGNPDVSTDAVTWTDSAARVEAPDQMSPANGMLFVAPSDGNNATDIAAAAPRGNGWDVTIREDDDPDMTGLSTQTESFQLLYVPWNAARLIGGHAEGDGSLVESAGQDRFDLSRDADGVYRLSVFENDGTTKLGEDDGALILSVASQMAGTNDLADRSFMSYEFDGTSGDFIIQSREVGGDGTSENIFGDVLALRDSDFYFAFIDFATPVAPHFEADFDKDGDVDGDDFLTWQANFPTEEGATMATGDADMDGDVDGDDFLVWQTQFGSSAGPDGGNGGAAIPEPGSISLLVLASIAAISRRRA